MSKQPAEKFFVLTRRPICYRKPDTFHDQSGAKIFSDLPLHCGRSICPIRGFSNCDPTSSRASFYSKAIAAADDCEHSHNQNVPAQTQCVIQSAAQNSHLGQVQLIQIPFVESVVGTSNTALTQCIQYFSFFPFLRRAPPIDALFS